MTRQRTVLSKEEFDQLARETLEGEIDRFLDTKRATIYGRYDIHDPESRKRAVKFFADFITDYGKFVNVDGL